MDSVGMYLHRDTLLFWGAQDRDSGLVDDIVAD